MAKFVLLNKRFENPQVKNTNAIKKKYYVCLFLFAIINLHNMEFVIL